MHNAGSVFSRPHTPAAKCLHIVRTNPVITRNELVKATGLSQPTITRAIAALLNTGLLKERTDLTQSHGRGRPSIPLEFADNNWMLAGLAIGTSSTYVALYDTGGRVIREEEVPVSVSQLGPDDLIQHLMAAVHRMSTGIPRRLVSVGVTSSGNVDDNGFISAPNLGWDQLDVAKHFSFQFGVPITVTAAVPSILGSEVQAAEFADTSTLLAIFADDSLAAALSDTAGVRHVPTPAVHGRNPQETLVTAGIDKRLATEDRAAVLEDRTRQLADLAAQLVREHRPDTVIIAGAAFYDNPQLFAATFRTLLGDAPVPQLRVIPSHQDIVRAIARAVALDPLVRTPLLLAG